MDSANKAKTLAILVLLGSAILLYAPGLSLAGQTKAGVTRDINSGITSILDVRGRVGKKSERMLQLRAATTYSLIVSTDIPAAFGSEGLLRLMVRDRFRRLVEKTLHAGDADAAILFRPETSGPVQIVLKSENSKSDLAYRLKVLEWKVSSHSRTAVEWEPNNAWQEANPIELGQTVFASADDQPYLPPPGHSSKEPAQEGEDWFRFEFDGGKPQLVFFNIDLEDRDNIPVDVSVFQVKEGKASAFKEGTDPVTPPHEVQALAGNKFTTRVLVEKGTYYVRVAANHPAYQLKTAAYDVPPYADPRQAVRTALDYLLSAGDSWHANTPRKGGIYDRIANVHAETSTCVACHPTHFTLRAQLYALQNGYPVKQRPQLQFLTERFYNNPRPFYGHPNASWSRVISAPANVLSRMAALLNIYEQEITHEFRDSFFRRIGEYLKLYYKNRTQLPPDESNGNTPIVSAYEVAWYSWVVLDELYRRTADREYSAMRDQVAGLIERGQYKNMLDLCYQTLAFCSIDRQRYVDRIRQNCEKILSLRRSSGQWPMTFDQGAPDAEFQTGHCLWTLAVAGYTMGDARIAGSVTFLLGRQQQFGGWFDPTQPYENFRTPFRESQMAVLALSTFYPERDKVRVLSTKAPKAGLQSSRKSSRGAWTAAEGQPDQLRFGFINELLDNLNRIWDSPQPKLLTQIRSAASHSDPFVRQAAILCLGRVGGVESIPRLKQALGDESKIVQRAAAWSLRQLAARKGIGTVAIGEALVSPGDRTRWGATRIFATHFSGLTQERRLLDGLLSASRDPAPAIRMQALKGLWQWWYWTPREADRSLIEDSFINQLAMSQHPWVRRNLQEGLYNIADENIRYLYNNWIPLLGMKADGEQAIGGRLLIERRLAGKIAAALKTGNPLQQEGLLRALSEFHLRDAASYDLARERNPAESRTSAGSYVRIGNDIETIQFFGDAAEVLARALLPFMDSNDAKGRQLAVKAAYTLREVRVPRTYANSGSSNIRDVLRLAGDHDEARQQLARAVYRRLLDSDQSVRAVARETYKVFTLDPESNAAEWNSLLRDLLMSSQQEARLAALEAISAAGKIPENRPAPERSSAKDDDADLASLVRKMLLSPDSDPTPALAALRSIPALHKDPQVLARMDQVLGSDNIRLFRAALSTVIKSPQMQESPIIRRKLDRIFSTRESKLRKTVLDLVSTDASLLADARVRSLVSEALLDKDSAVAVSALNLIRQDGGLQGRPEVVSALSELRGQPRLSPALEAALRAFSREESDISSVNSDASSKLLDFRFFVERVQKILTTPGRDHNACADCHNTHAILRLNSPGDDDENNEDELRQNYRSALKVVNLLDPEKSLLLRKPTSNSETEGTVGSAQLSHGGGIRWSRDSEEYRTILEWIQGGKLAAAHK